MATNFKQIQETQAGMQRATEVMNRCVAFIITFSGIGNRRKVSSSDVEVDADKAWIGVSKKLFDAPEWKAIQTLDGEARRYVTDRCALILKNGIYMMPADFVEDVRDKLTEFNRERNELVGKLIRVYDATIAESRKRLRGLFDASEYPTVEEIREAFKITWRVISWDTPANLKNVSKAVYEEEQKKAAASWKEMQADMQQILRVSMADLVDHLVDKLTPDEKGKKKVFRDTAVTKIQEFLATFDARNVTNDVELKAMALKARNLIEGVDAQTLRDSRGTRENVRAGFEKIARAFDTMLVDKPTRSISFED
jgi:hypothetical protein